MKNSEEEKVRWGILGAANIAVKKVIPAMKSAKHCEIKAIASRDLEKARKVANELDIDESYGTYEALLESSSIDAIYIPLPNHLHFEWTRKAAEAGKHVLCEKPIGLNAEEVRELINVREQTGVKIQEAFMVRTHPTWLAVKDLVRSGRIGRLKAITGFFSYFNDDKSNIRNRLEMGGGAMLDIGCYCVNASRFLFDSEPDAVSGFVEKDKETGIDQLSSAILRFPDGHATFTCSTQLVPYQKLQFLGTEARIEVQIPFNIPVESPTKIFISDGSDLYDENIEIIEFEPANQYTIQGDEFSKAILRDIDQAVALEDSFYNMAAVDAVFRSAETGCGAPPETL